MGETSVEFSSTRKKLTLCANLAAIEDKVHAPSMVYLLPPCERYVDMSKTACTVAISGLLNIWWRFNAAQPRSK